MKKDLKHTIARVKEANEDGSVRFRLTNLQVDRHGEVVVPDGIRLAEFKKNPIVLFGHGFETSVPIGKIVPESFDVNKDFVDANIIFDDNDPFAKMIGDKVRNGFLNAGSVGFMANTISNDPVLPKQTGVTIKEWELFEFSIVPIPSNSSALALREFRTECKTLAPDLDIDDQFETYIKSAEKLEQHKKDLRDVLDEFTVPATTFKELVDRETGGVVTSKLIEQMKSGRVLSSKNRTLVKSVADNMRGLLSELDILLEATEPKGNDEDTDVGKSITVHTNNGYKKLDINEIQNSLNITKLQNELNILKTI